MCTNTSSSGRFAGWATLSRKLRSKYDHTVHSFSNGAMVCSSIGRSTFSVWRSHVHRLGALPSEVSGGISDQTGAFYRDRKSTRLNSSHLVISYAVFCLKKKKKDNEDLVNNT